MINIQGHSRVLIGKKPAQHSVPHQHRDKYALDGWYASRFLGFPLSFERFPFLSLSLTTRQ